MEASNVKTYEKFSKFTEEALDAVNKIYDLISKPCVFREEVLQACREARAILYNPPITKTPPRNCDAFTKAEVLEMLGNCSYSKEDTIEWLYAAKGECDGNCNGGDCERHKLGAEPCAGCQFCDAEGNI